MNATAQLSPIGRKLPPKLTQPLLDQMLDAHVRWLTGKAGGKRWC